MKKTSSLSTLLFCLIFAIFSISFSCKNLASSNSETSGNDLPDELPNVLVTDSFSIRRYFNDPVQIDTTILFASKKAVPQSMAIFVNNLNNCGGQRPGILCFSAPQLITTLGGDVDGYISRILTGWINEKPGGFTAFPPKLDFVFSVNSYDKIRIKLGSGDGTFWRTYTYTMGNGPTDIALGDFNRDGYKDIISANSNAQSARIRWGHTNFTHWTEYSLGHTPRHIDARDLNADGKVDFVVSAGLRVIVALRNAANNGFNFNSYNTTDAIQGTVSLVDLDNDNDFDLVYSTYNEYIFRDARVKVRRNNGDGTFGEEVTFDPNVSNSEDRIFNFTLADFNKDGNLDIIVVLYDYLIRAFGNGDGTFSNSVKANVSDNTYRIYSHDFDKDGNLDIIISHHDGISIYLGVGDGDFNTLFLYNNLLNYDNSDLAFGDFNQDGLTDILYSGKGANHSANIYMMLANP